MTSSTETLRQIDARHNAASTQWSFDCQGGVTTLTAVDHGTTDASKIATMFTRHNPADAEFLAAAYDDIAELLAMVRRAAQMINAQNSPPNKAQKPLTPLSQSAAIAMGFMNFWKWLQEVHGLVLPKNADKKQRQDAVNIAVRKILNIASRRELDTDPAAAKRWKTLNSDYWNWKKNQ